jgi:GNAT superfamily N-acetyltransferase
MTAVEGTSPRLALMLTDRPDARAKAAIEAGIGFYNEEKASYRDQRQLAVLVSDPATREVIGGLLGRTSLGLFFIDLLYLPDRLRGQNTDSRIIRLAEEEAQLRGCTAVVRYTIHFQAPGFYQHLGYRELGRIECDPPGHTRICMTKHLDAPDSGKV